MNETFESAAEATAKAVTAVPDPAPETLLTHLAEFLDAGGPVVLILLACSVVALAIVLMKLWQFHAARLG